jgi:hypothetical protein
MRRHQRGPQLVVALRPSLLMEHMPHQVDSVTGMGLQDVVVVGSTIHRVAERELALGKAKSRD